MLSFRVLPALLLFLFLCNNHSMFGEDLICFFPSTRVESGQEHPIYLDFFHLHQKSVTLRFYWSVTVASFHLTNLHVTPSTEGLSTTLFWAQ